MAPVASGISKRVSRQTAQEVCPWNVRFSRELAEDSPFRPRAALAGRSPRQLAADLLAMSQEEFTAAFRKSPMKRAKLRGLKRNAAVVLGNVGTADEIGLLEGTYDEAPDQMVRDHAAWALDRVTSNSGGCPTPRRGAFGGRPRV